jgi:PHS family inorganic phosphate transporter-like MFS transporter
VWDGGVPHTGSIYASLLRLAWQSMALISGSAFAGCIITGSKIQDWGRKNTQLISFLGLFVLFIVVGSSFKTLSTMGADGTYTMISIYILVLIHPICQYERFRIRALRLINRPSD